MAAWKATLLDAFEDHGGAEIRATLGLGSQSNFVAFDDALAAERGGVAAHVHLDVEGDLIADNLAIVQRQGFASGTGHGAGQLFTILFEGISEGKRVITHLQGSGPIARNIGGQRDAGKNGAKHSSGEENSSSHDCNSTAGDADKPVMLAGGWLAGRSACPTLLDAFEKGGAEIGTALGSDVQGNFVSLDDAFAGELGGSAVRSEE